MKCAEESQIPATWIKSRLVQIHRHTVVHGGDEVSALDWRTLAVGDRYQRHLVEAEIKRMQVRQILAAVQRRYGAAGTRPKQWKMKLVDVEVQDVEIVGAFVHTVQH